MLRHLIAVPLVLALSTGVAWAYWTAGSNPGGNGASAVAAVNQGSLPTATAVGRTVTVAWAPTTLTTGQAVTGYTVKRYSGSTVQTLLSACTGTIAGTSCVESNVPAGTWTYSVTPVFATNWLGGESAKSSPLTVGAPTLALSSAPVKPGTASTGTAAGFVGGDTVQYRLDSATGTLLTGSLAGVSTPAAVPGSGGGSVAVTIPAGTSDGVHTVYAVASPSGDTASAGVVVDGTAPPLPVLTLTPTATSGDSVTFAYTEAEASATVDCNLDGAPYATCSSPVGYAGLAAGSHTFQARATDTVGNVSAAVSYTWTVDVTVPTVAIAYPTSVGVYNDSGFNAGCGTASTGDVCGSADDDVTVTAVKVSLKRLSTGLWWNGTSFSAAAETWNAATGTSSWNYAIAATALAEGDYTVRAQASDGVNLGYDARTFTVDRTAPATPTLTGVPPSTSGPSATFTFTDTDTTASFECQRDGGAWTACASPQTYSNLTHGSHTVGVRAVDGAGNTSSGTSTTWTVDATAPATSMTFPTATSYNVSGWTAGCGTSATGDLCGTASDVGSGVTAVALSIRRVGTNSYWDGSAFVAATETWLGASGTTSWSYLFAGTSFPADGHYIVRWRATDAVGNATVAAVDLTLDTTPPPSAQIGQAPSDPSGAAVRFAFTDTEAGTTAECRLDAGVWTTCTAPVDYSGLAGGSHTFGVRVTDAAGNVSTPISYTWTVNIGLPIIAIGFPDHSHAYNNTTFAVGCGTPAGDLCGTATDPQGSVSSVAVSIRRTSTSLYWNGTSFASATEVFMPAVGTTSWSYAITAASFPTEENYTVHARATNNAGATGFDTTTLTIDRTAPAVPTIVTGPTGTTAGTDTFAFTDEAGATFECRLDAGSWTACTSPKTNGALADGSHTFDVRAIDAAGNTGAATSRTWIIDVTAPTGATTFPVAATAYNNATYNAGCGTTTTGDICGTASDASSGVSKVEVSVQRASTGLYLTGTAFTAASQTWLTATGTTSWSYALAGATFPGDGTYTLVVRATDAVGNAASTSRTFVIDRTAPTAVGFTTTNIATVNKLEAGDTFTLTYSEPVAPGSIVASWTGTTTQNVVIRAAGSGQATDKLTIYDATNTTLLPLGTVNLNRTDYVNGMKTFGASGTASTLTMNGSSLTITLGTASGAVTTAATAGNVSWTPSALVTDLAGNPAATTVYTETDLDTDF